MKTFDQLSFWGNVDYPNNKTALLARNKKARELKKQGLSVTLWTLRDQLQKYDNYVPSGKIGNVYMINVVREVS